MRDSWFWLSFCDPGLPQGSQFLGGTVVRGWNLGSAIAEAWSLKINPGGEVLGIPCQRVPPDRWRNRLLSREEIKAMEEADKREGGRGWEIQESSPAPAHDHEYWPTAMTQGDE